ncbi:PEP-CTERM sorting domain-containing protein [Paludibaculum fermentans]|uniref:PEP-CTERM sorting domain-containing protein n=1 Tax=Paludibaculum fermentans TaxID=1473598 RepID=UPI003EBA41F2
MPALAEHIQRPGITRRLWSWIPLLVCLMAISLTTPTAKASFILQYNSAAFSNDGLNCSSVQCLSGSLTLEFNVLGAIPAPSTPFCLDLNSLGSTSGSCLPVGLASLRNGATQFQIVGNPNNLATLQLSPDASYWLVYLDGQSNQNPPTSVLTRNSATGGSDLLILNDGTHGAFYGRSNVPGTWTIIEPSQAPVPEPATWLAMATGLGLVGLLRRKRKPAARSAHEPEFDSPGRSQPLV